MFKLDSMSEIMNNQTEDFDIDKRLDFFHFETETNHLENDVDFDKRIFEERNDREEIKDCDLISLYEIMTLFEPERFNEISVDEKAFVIDLLRDSLVEELQMENSPEIILADLDNDVLCGFTLKELDAIVINTHYLYDGNEVRDTVIHEVRHFWQEERAELPEEEQTAFDKALKENLENYISPEDNYREYRYQLVEMDARGYATSLVEDMRSVTGISRGI